MTTRTVTINTVMVGESFGCVGVVRDARTGRTLAKTKRVYPYQMTTYAVEGAEMLAFARGWTVVHGGES